MDPAALGTLTLGLNDARSDRRSRTLDRPAAPRTGRDACAARGSRVPSPALCAAWPMSWNRASTRRPPAGPATDLRVRRGDHDMRLTTTTNVSVDGVMQGLGGPDEDRRGGFDRGGWAIPLVDTEAGDHLNEVYGGAAAFLFGRRTYEIFAGSWGTGSGGQIRATTRSQWR